MKKNAIFLGLLIGLPLSVKIIIDNFSGGGWENSIIYPWVVSLAHLFLDTFKSPAVAIIASFCILICGVVLAVFFLFIKTRRIVISLTSARDRIREPLRKNSDLINHVRIALSDDNEIENIYKRALDRSQGELNTRFLDAFEYGLKNDNFDRHGLSIAFFRDAPEFFVAAGLILTFCGLVAGLYFASKGLMAADISVARESLNKLLAASTMKFLTSIAGVGSSLLLSLAYRIGVDRITDAKKDMVASVGDLLRENSSWSKS